MTYNARMSIMHSPARIHLVPEKDKLISLVTAMHEGGIRLVECTYDASGVISDEEIASNIAVLFMFPMNLPFHMVADSLFETTQNPFFVTLLCLPYLMIFAAGAVGVSKSR